MAPSPITEDYYKVLGVVQTASTELIIRSYKRLALKLHPDRNANQDATESFQLVCQLSLSIIMVLALILNAEAWESL